MAWIGMCPGQRSRTADEAKLTSMEEARKAAVEVEKEEDAPPQESAEDEEEIAAGVWGNTGSSRAPVKGVIANGFADW